MNTRKNMRVAEAMLMWLRQDICAEERTGDFSGGGALLRHAAVWCVERLLRRRRAAGDGVLSSLWACAAGSERGTRERERENGTVREKGVSRGLFIGTWPANGAD